MPASVLDWGVQLILSLQHLGDWLVGVMNAFTFLGNEDFFLLLFPFLYWCVEAQVGLRIGTYLILSISFHELFKAGFHGPRPYWFNDQVRLLTGAESSFGIPSAHSGNSVVIWAGLASQIKRRWAWGVAIFLALFVGFSRIYLGVHFPTDVLFGWILGALILALALGLEKPVLAWLRSFRPGQRVAMYFCLSLAFILANVWIVQTVSHSFSVPETWVQNARLAAPEADPIAPFSLGGMVTIMAAAFGFLAGVEWLALRGGFDTRGDWGLRAGRFFIGIVGVMVLRYGLDAVFSLLADDLTPFGYILRYIRYATIGFWMAALAPVLFIRFKLATKAREIP